MVRRRRSDITTSPTTGSALSVVRSAYAPDRPKPECWQAPESLVELDATRLADRPLPATLGKAQGEHTPVRESEEQEGRTDDGSTDDEDPGAGRLDLLVDPFALGKKPQAYHRGGEHRGDAEESQQDPSATDLQRRLLIVQRQQRADRAGAHPEQRPSEVRGDAYPATSEDSRDEEDERPEEDQHGAEQNTPEGPVAVRVPTGRADRPSLVLLVRRRARH